MIEASEQYKSLTRVSLMVVARSVVYVLVRIYFVKLAAAEIDGAT